MSQFGFAAEFKDFHELVVKAENTALADPRASAVFSRLAVETMVDWLYKADTSLRPPYEDNLNALIGTPEFRRLASPTILTKLHLIRKIGNSAAHKGAFDDLKAQSSIRELHHIAWWLADNYARVPPGVHQFDPTKLPRKSLVDQTTLRKAGALIKAHEQARKKAREELEALKARSETERQSLEAEIARLRAEVSAIKEAANDRSSTHDFDEAQTRTDIIDVLLNEAGWPLTDARDREFEVSGMPSPTGAGKVDYVLWGADGKPLAVVEAKRTTVDADAGRQQAKLYADCLEKRYGVRPLIFYTNGYEHWFWDDKRYPPRAVAGFFTRDELDLIIQRRTLAKPLAEVRVNEKIAGGDGRTYQEKAIRRVAERFDDENQREALLVMATGSGKTRMSIALVDLLMRAGWVKRVLFLADRKELVKQAANAFSANLPDVPTANLLTERESNARICVCTYPTMMNLIDRENDEGVKRFGPGAFDLVIIDEAHRSVYRKYKAIFDYFDSFLVGLTATPKDEIDKNTYELFHQEDGVPTDAYDLPEAVKQGFLVPPRAIDVPIKFPREGIRYDDLSDEEKEEWDALEWGDDGPPDEVSGAALNDWLFNADTIDKVLKHLMENGYYVDDGERIAKTIVFAKNKDHAKAIVERYDHHYPKEAGKSCRVIVSGDSYSETLVDELKDPNSALRIAVSVDMLDTGIDIPEVANLVFFKIVRSKSKFWQMIGRGTRLCPDLFAPGDHKKDFLVFDFLENVQFFNADVAHREASSARPLQSRIFEARVTALGLLNEIDASDGQKGVGEGADGIEGSIPDLKDTLLAQVKSDVYGMNLDNFIVRTQRRSVEKFQSPEIWSDLSEQDRNELIENLADIPTTEKDPDVDAKRFDLLCLQIQLGLLKRQDISKLRNRMQETVQKLEAKESIPDVSRQMVLIQEIGGQEYWEGVTPQMIEQVRRNLRSLIRLIDKQTRKRLTTNFIDTIGPGIEVPLTGLDDATAFLQFKKKTEHYLEQHRDHIALEKLRRGVPLTQTDLSEIESMLLDAGLGDREAIDQLGSNNDAGLPGFIRSVVGMDRQAASLALNKALASENGVPLTATQIDFLERIVDWLARDGVIDPQILWEAPFNKDHPQGVMGIFPQEQVKAIIGALESLKPRLLG